MFLTPAVAQHSVIIPFDSGEQCKEVTFRMKPAWVVKAGARYARHTPDNEQLKDAKLKVSEEQPHIGETPNRASPEAVREFVGALTGEPVPDWQERNKAQSAVIANGGEPATPKPRKPRQRRAKISATKPDGTIPVTLGGKLPPVSVLARREFGIRVLKRNPAGQHGQSKQEIGDRASGETPGTANEGPPCWREAEGEAPGRANQS